jgi:PIN domain nuclease of toxin-antitoxin system
MRLLLDTQVFLWMASGSSRVPDGVRDAVRDPGHEVYLSVASVWELAIKQQIGRIALPGPAAEFAAAERSRHAVASLPITESAIAHLTKLPDVHRDPFDRLLVCQAIEHEMTLVSADRELRRYAVRILWSGR